MTIASPTELSDRELLEAIVRTAQEERRTTVELLTLLAELDARRLYLGEGCSSLFAYCTQVLHLSEHAAYHRIEGARAARQFPVLLDLLADGALTLTTVALLRPHLTPENHLRLLDAARHKTKRAVEHQMACLAPQPDARTLLRRISVPSRAVTPAPGPAEPPSTLDYSTVDPPKLNLLEAAVGNTGTDRPAPAVIAPLAQDRYLLKVTIAGDTHAKLRRAQDLLRYTIPTGDTAVILDRALTMLVEHLERTKTAKTSRPREVPRALEETARRASSRHIPAAVKRAVWARDEGRCTFEGPRGRCRETGRLEFHHIVPFASGGQTAEANLALRCRAHNSFEGERQFGPWMDRAARHASCK